MANSYHLSSLFLPTSSSSPTATMQFAPTVTTTTARYEFINRASDPSPAESPSPSPKIKILVTLIPSVLLTLSFLFSVYYLFRRPLRELITSCRRRHFHCLMKRRTRRRRKWRRRERKLEDGYGPRHGWELLDHDLDLDLEDGDGEDVEEEEEYINPSTSGTESEMYCSSPASSGSEIGSSDLRYLSSSSDDDQDDNGISPNPSIRFRQKKDRVDGYASLPLQPISVPGLEPEAASSSSIPPTPLSKYFDPSTHRLRNEIVEPPSPLTPGWERRLRRRVHEGRGIGAWVDRMVDRAVKGFERMVEDDDDDHYRDGSSGGGYGRQPRTA